MRLSSGLLAGLFATVVLSLIMLGKAYIGLAPELDIPTMLASMVSTDNVLIGWVIHFIIGTVGYGLAIAAFHAATLSSPLQKGLILGGIGWLFMMLILMPLAGLGFFAMELTILAPALTLMLHLIFGALLGWFFGLLLHRI